ncbi:uncharacterized protein LOC108887506 isoform X8 [Lates calcarifer]|uniref:Uncharacterized protein LOC108887506 isoform X8 n=1 Tax=Lates calcarifer TaxID=8187 RepID=A0AAJ8B744_LATCA|nr:uncharacterized protein LOC108887506 isoform X8 [Lates calcarifer]
MAEFRWIQMSLLMILLLQFTATATGQYSSIFTVRDEDEATLSCENVIDDQDQCDRTDWIFIGSGSRTVTLFEHGKIHEAAKSKSDRLSVTENCSLVIKKVTVKDVGRYICRQFDRSGQQQDPDALVVLSVVTMTEQKNRDQVTLNCSVRTHGHCRHTVKWLYNSHDVDKDIKELKTSSSCSSSVNFLTSHYIYKLRHKFFSCEVTDNNNRHKITFSLQSSPEKSGDDSTTTTTIKTAGATTIATTTDGASTKTEDWLWLYITVAVVLTLLIALVMAVGIKRHRAKGNKTQTDDNVQLTPVPAVVQSAPETGLQKKDSVDPEDGVSYASVSYTKKTDSKPRVHKHVGDENDAVTYSAVKVSSADPNNLYASIS